jgi:hypothetical protein
MSETLHGVTIWKGGEEIGNADHCAVVPSTTRSWEGIKKLEYYYFGFIKLSSPVVFEHLSGRALKYYLDHCILKSGDAEIGPLRYVHGRSEVMKGRHRVGVVLLVKVEAEDSLQETDWLMYLPGIYKEFWDSRQEDEKTS